MILQPNKHFFFLFFLMANQILSSVLIFFMYVLCKNEYMYVGDSEVRSWF